MRLIIAGGEREVRVLASTAGEAGIDARTIAEPDGHEASVTALAARLRELEASIASERPDAVVVADDTDAALAALLAATKVGVPAVAVAGAGSSSSNGRLISSLADERLHAGPTALGDWARSYTEAR